MSRKEAWPPKVFNHRGRARVRIKGKDRYLGPFGSSEANEAYRKLLSETSPAEGEPLAGQAYPTIALLCERFLEHKTQTRGENWRELTNYKLAFRPLVRLYGRHRAAEFKAKDLESLMIRMALGDWITDSERQWYDENRKPYQWSRNVIRARVGRIRTMWAWCEREGYAPEGSAAHLGTARPPDLQDQRVRRTTKTKPTTREDLDKVLPLLPRPVAAMLEIQWLTGMRSGEVRIMRPCDIDRTGEVWVYRPSRHKNLWRGQDRVIHLGPECQKLLAPWLDREPEEYCFKPVRRRAGVKPCYSCESFAQAVRKACKKAGVKLIPYGGRHAAKMRIARQFGLQAAADVLGQKSLHTTEKYGSLDMENAAEVMKKLA